jgi:Na+/melibiose symporter-like transporter
MRTVWRLLAEHRDLRLLLSAALVSQSGDWILLTGLLYHVYALTGSTVAPALTLLASLVPQVVLGPIAGVFADRWDRKQTMILADLLLAAGLLPLLAVHGRGQIWIVILVLAWEGAVQQFFTPAQLALLPRLIPAERLAGANALSGQMADGGRFAGAALGGVIVAIGGVPGVALADAATFLLSALVLGLIRTSGAVQRNEPPAGLRRVAAVGHDLRAGLRLTAGSQVLRALMAFGLVTGIGEGIVATLIAPFIRHDLHGSSQEFGLFLSAQAIGGITGGVLAVWISQQRSATAMLTYGAISVGVLDLAIFLYPLGYDAAWPALIGIILVGLPVALTVAGLMTLFQQSSSDGFRGRIFGAYGATQGVAILLGTLAGGLLARPLGIIAVISVQGAGYLVAGVLMALWLSGRRSVVPVPAAAAE